jgi:ABC-type multidrug transport system fused ATPase/permease subunit
MLTLPAGLQVSQEPVLYARSVRRNILYGMEAEDGVPPEEVPTQQDVEEAARCMRTCVYVCVLGGAGGLCIYTLCDAVCWIHGVWTVCCRLANAYEFICALPEGFEVRSPGRFFLSFHEVKLWNERTAIIIASSLFCCRPSVGNGECN